MKFSKIINLFLCLSFIISMSLYSVSADYENPESTIPSAIEMMSKGNYAPGQIIVSMKIEVSGRYRKVAVAKSLFDNINTTNVKKLTYNPLVDETPYKTSYSGKKHLFNENRYRDIYLLTLSDETNMADVLDQLNKRDDVENAHPNYFALPTATYDPESVNQWYLDNIGVGAAWDKGFTGKASISIGLMDTGINPHDDLIENIDYTLGWDFYQDISNVADTYGHGTYTAGVMGADLNGIGITGVCKDVTIIPLKVADLNGYGHDSEMIDAVNYAIIHDIDILNLNYATIPSPGLEQAVESYTGLFIGSAGNSSENIDIHPNVHSNNVQNWIVVGASGTKGTYWQFSNYGATYVDLFAPGVNIYTTTSENTYDYVFGTSFSAPNVTAAAAIIMSHATHLTPLQVKDLLLNTVNTNSSFSGKCVTGGRLSLINAVNYLYSEVRSAYSKGDLNGDGKVTSTDYLIVKKIVLGTYTPTTQQINAADVNKSGSVTSVDYIMVQRYFNQTYYFSPY